MLFIQRKETFYVGKKNIGFTDAAEKKLFEIDGYIQGVAQFIGICNTPMTISIQGSWGIGKTGLFGISLIKDNA